MELIRHRPLDPPPHRSDAVQAAGLVYTAGMTAADPDADTATQSQQVLDKLDIVLEDAGTDKTRLLWANVWLADMDDFAAFNEVWNAWLVPGTAPARACVEARLARPELRVEVAVVAASR